MDIGQQSGNLLQVLILMHQFFLPLEMEIQSRHYQLSYRGEEF